jgi:hypothetical protein
MKSEEELIVKDIATEESSKGEILKNGDGITERSAPTPNWSDAKKWWMDLLKSALTFSLISVAAIIFLESRQDKRSIEQYQRQSTLQFRLGKLEQFKSASLRYQVDMDMCRTYLIIKLYEPGYNIKITPPVPDPRDVYHAEHTLFDEFHDNQTLTTLSEKYMSTIHAQRNFYLQIYFGANTNSPEKSREEFDRYDVLFASAQGDLFRQYELLILENAH